MHQIVLASGSPRRKEILALLGLEFVVMESGFDEESVKSDDPRELVEELALQKALAVREKLGDDARDTVIVGGDTVVHLNGEIQSKLESEAEAKRVIGLLSGKEHEVFSGVAVVSEEEQYVESDVARVKFLDLSDIKINEYVKGGKWRGFAGGYALQGAAAELIEGYDGRLSTIIGMPVEIVTDLLECVGVNVHGNPVEVEEIIRGMKVGLDD